MKLLLPFILFFLLTSSTLSAQVITTCSGTYLDSGGNGSDYSNNENTTTTYCSSTPGQCVSMTFTSFSTESCCDELTIYDGNSTAAPQIGVFAGTSLAGQTITSTTGCLTFVFTSDGSVVDAGWRATISCGTCPSCSDGIQNGSETGVDCGGSCPACAITSCNTTYFDSGGAGADYSNSENNTIAYCPSAAGQCTEVTFTTFSTESCCDELTIYDGNSTSAPQIGVFRGTTLAGQTIQATTGCLTFVFTSDGSVVDVGWEANVRCVTCPTCSDGILNGSEVGVDCGGPTCPPCPCSSLPVINDEACCATPVPVNADNNCTQTVSGTVAGATPSFNASTCTGGEDDDVWYSFVATSTEHNISLTNVAGSVTDLVHAVYGGTCNSTGVELSCSDPDNSNVSGLTIGDTYFVRVYTFSSTGGQTTTFDLCITSPCAGIPEPTCNLNYAHTPTIYNPANYNTGTTIAFADDRFANSFTPMGFDFCFDGVTYSDCMVSSNGYLIFPGCYSEHAGNDVIPGGSSPFSISAAIPNTNNAPRNAIMGPWQDIDPSIAGSTIRTSTEGIAPNRVFIAKFDQVGMFDCTTQQFSGQIKLFETTNIIEIHIGEKTVCTTFNGGAAIMGLHDYTGTQAVVPAGYNFPTQWSVSPLSPEGHQFTPNCPGGVCTVLLTAKLASIDAMAIPKANKVNWEMTSEEGINHYVLEKSTNGYSFVAVKTLPSSGTNVANAYEYEDKEIDTPVTYYRLRMVGDAGNRNYSRIVVVDRGTALTDETKVFPNPATGNTVTIGLAKESTITAVYMNNYLGQKTKIDANWVSPYEMQMQVGELAKGNYVVEIHFEDGRSVFRKLILR